MIARRHFLLLGTALAGIFVLAGRARAQPVYEVSYSDAEWRRRLTPAQYGVLRQQGPSRLFPAPY